MLAQFCKCFWFRLSFFVANVPCPGRFKQDLVGPGSTGAQIEPECESDAGFKAVLGGNLEAMRSDAKAPERSFIAEH